MPREPRPFRHLVNLLKHIPGVGEGTARRFALFFLSAPHSYVQDLSQALMEVKEHVGLCRDCFNISEGDLCSICADSQRDSNVICVVEDVASLMNIENTGIYRGKYHVLHGTISPIDGIGPEELKMDELLRRVERGKVNEVIIATGSSVEGETTAIYLAERLKKRKIPVTRLAHGIPLGAHIRYVDPRTLEQALRYRVKL